MRYVYIVLSAVLIAAIACFTVQNMQHVTVTLFSSSISLPASLLIAMVYVLGMLTGGFMLSVARSWIKGAKRPATAKV